MAYSKCEVKLSAYGLYWPIWDGPYLAEGDRFYRRSMIAERIAAREFLSGFGKGAHHEVHEEHEEANGASILFYDTSWAS